MPEHFFQEASEEGIELNYEKIHYIPNTENVHSLIERARQIDRANELVDLFLRLTSLRASISGGSVVDRYWN